MFERFTNRARHVVVLAQEEARNLQHNYIGTEHILLGLLGEPNGVAGNILTGAAVGMTLEGARNEVLAIIGPGKSEPKGHIPFTPRAKKVLELALREALGLHHTYIGTEHILLGLIREGDGVGVQILKEHSDLLAIRVAVLDAVPAGRADAARARRWLRRRIAGEPHEPGQQPDEPAEHTVLSATPAADTTLSEAARLAGAQPVGSHHLLLAALTDPDTAAARALVALGLDVDQAKEALRTVDVTGTSDEPPEEAGRRQMVIRVTDDRLTLEATDPMLVKTAQDALQALGSEDDGIPGDHPAATSLATVWQALHDSLKAIHQRTAKPDDPGQEPPSRSMPAP